ncbi:MAG: hypothetical protein K2P78_06395 [Gemmataceae bacterium]|nr:hypothetical protein [Gemmataceae bacterium]
MLEPLDRRDVPASFLWTNAYGDSDALNQDNWVRDDGEHAVPSGAATVVYFGGTMAGYTGANADSVGLSQLSGSWLMFDSTYTATVTAAGGQSLANVVMPSGNLVVSGDATIQYVMQTGGSITVAGNATVSNLGESGGEFTVAGDANITTASVNSGSVWLWEEATVGSLSVYSGTAEVDGAAAITTLAVRGGMATLSGGRVGSATVTDDPYTAGGSGVLALKAGTSFEGFTMDAGEVVQDAAADMTVTNSFTWTGGDITVDGNAASLTLDGAKGLIAPAEAGSLTIGDTIQLINEAYATFNEGTLAFAGGDGIVVDSDSTAEIAPPANANTAVTFAPAGSTVGPQVIHLVNGGEYLVGRVNRTAIGYHTT